MKTAAMLGVAALMAAGLAHGTIRMPQGLLERISAMALTPAALATAALRTRRSAPLKASRMAAIGK